MKPKISSDIPPPKPRAWTRRLPAGAADLAPGDSILCDDAAQAGCVVSYGRRLGWKTARRAEGEKGKVRVWRLHTSTATL